MIFDYSEPPKLKTELKPVTSEPGKEIKLQCEIVAEPKPEVEWLKDGKVIKVCICWLFVKINPVKNKLIPNET